MKNPLLWLAAGGLLLWFLLIRKNPAAPKTGPTLPNPGTATTAPSPWSPVVQIYNDAQTKSASDVAIEAANALPGLYSGVKGLFGGSSTATGSASPKTSGSGTGTPDASTTVSDAATFLDYTLQF